MLSGVALLAAALFGVQVDAQTSSALEPLSSKHFTWPNVPFQVTGDQGGIRGPQSGYNQCNSSTENQQSMCQTLFLNSLDDFCMWSSNMDGDTDTIGDGEAREVAWCTKKGHGTRIIPQGALTGAQWLYAKNYVQVVGYIDQSKINLDPTDEGGELDPHGADEQGNPLGGIVFTNGFGMSADKYAQQIQANSTASQQFTQVIEWIDFQGGNMFCLKMCNPSDSQAAELCQHIYDRIGCSYNALADYASINGTFSVCDSDDMTPPGVYTSNGVTTTWFQPPEGVVPTPPYTPTLPASSNCHTFSSAQLFGGPATSSAASGSAGGSAGASGSKSGSGSGSAASSTGSGAAISTIASGQWAGFAPVVIAFGVTIFTMVVSLAAL